MSKGFFEKKEIQIVCFLSFLFFIFLFSNYLVNYQLLKKAIQSYEFMVFSRVDGKLTDWVDERFVNIEKIQNHIENSKIADLNELHQELKRIKKISNFSDIFIGLNNGEFLISEDAFILPKDYDPRKRGWYNETLHKQSTIISKPYASVRMSLPEVAICTPIKILNVDGVICGGQLFDMIQKYILSYNSLYEKNIYLVDENGIVLASSSHHENSPKFLNVKVLDNEQYTVLKISHIPWDLVLEKNKTIYSERLNIQLLLNLFLYSFCILLYLMINLFWISKKKKIEHELLKHKDYFSDFNNFMQNHTLRGVMVCDSSSKIVLWNQTFSNLLHIDGSISENENFYEFLSIIQSFDPFVKNQIVALIKHVKETSQPKYMNLMTINPEKKLLLTISPFGSKQTNIDSILLSLQDTTDFQIATSSISQEMILNEKLYNAHLEKLLMFIENNLDDESLDIEKLAHVCSYSKYHLQRIFKNYCGENIASYIRRLRMEKSAFLLKYSDDKVSVIAALCGFSYNQTYVRAFAKYYHFSPSDFRDIQLFNTIDINSYEIIDIKSFSMLIIYNTTTLKENVKSVLENIVDEIKFDDIESIKMVGIYTNDCTISLKGTKNEPYTYGILLQNNQSISDIKNFPIRTFKEGKYIKIHFDPLNDNLELMIQKLYMKFYKARAYNSNLVNILQYPQYSNVSYFDNNMVKSYFLIELPSNY